ncbi:PHD transcription factor [Fusarium albosuccineum]|uniref:PHD transcription factor n=1 Tax=Fusarium albosuccineum TaxID=1237068 RepID=A0A8H4LJ33_9HYPO|nr:PHD transcription factor [Fusarium albosuccineum]
MQSRTTSVSPYETDTTKIPQNDRYADIPLYGRYGPAVSDFKPQLEHINSTSSQSLRYWGEVLSLCNDSTLAYKNELDDDGRDVFALGSVIIKSGHLHKSITRDYSYNDANEVAAIALAREPLAKLGISVPEIYFTGKIHGRDVLVQQRIPGVGLNIAKQYLSSEEMGSFKEQARVILRTLRDIEAPTSRSYIVPAPDPVKNRRIRQEEADIIFSDANTDTDFCFMHNDFTESNTIVDDGKIVGLVDWEMAGWFGWETARQVHLQIRGPRKESFAHLEGKKEFEHILWQLFFWRDLYDAA